MSEKRKGTIVQNEEKEVEKIDNDEDTSRYDISIRSTSNILRIKRTKYHVR